MFCASFSMSMPRLTISYFLPTMSPLLQLAIVVAAVHQ